MVHWYGSILFALFRRFPIFSTRLFSLLLMIVYAGWVVLWSVQSEDTWALTMEDPLYPLTIVVMMLLGLTGVAVLPWLKTASDAEAQQVPGTDLAPMFASIRPPHSRCLAPGPAPCLLASEEPAHVGRPRETSPPSGNRWLRPKTPAAATDANTRRLGRLKVLIYTCPAAGLPQTSEP